MPRPLPSELQLIKIGQCLVCNGDDVQEIARQIHFTILHCHRCGHRFIDPSLDGPSQIWLYQSSDRLKMINASLEDYYELCGTHPKSQTYHEYNTTLQKLESYVLSKTLLEIGCGKGAFLEIATHRGWQSCGVDSNAENIALIQSKGISGVAADFMNYRPTQRFDCVALWDLIEHSQDPKAILQKAAEYIKPGGVLLLGSPYYPNLLSHLAVIFYKISGARLTRPLERLYFIEHNSYFSKSSLAHLLRDIHFEIVDFWKTNTDIDRYKFSAMDKLVLKVLFSMAQISHLQNRFILIARPC